jgi:hypothetical protein
VAFEQSGGRRLRVKAPVRSTCRGERRPREALSPLAVVSPPLPVVSPLHTMPQAAQNSFITAIRVDPARFADDVVDVVIERGVITRRKGSRGGARKLAQPGRLGRPVAPAGFRRSARPPESARIQRRHLDWTPRLPPAASRTCYAEHAARQRHRALTSDDRASSRGGAETPPHRRHHDGSEGAGAPRWVTSRTPAPRPCRTTVDA